MPAHDQDPVSSTTYPLELLCCLAPFSVVEFFRDAPWLNVPENRRAEITIESLYPRGRLLGGSPASQDAPPKSKLAALAAARKKKENVGTAGKEVNSSVALLDKLETRLQTTKIEGQPDQPRIKSPESASKLPDPPLRRYPAKKRQSSEPAETQDRDAKRSQTNLAPGVKDVPVVVPAPVARPSSFAQTLCGPAASVGSSSQDLKQSSFLFPAYAKADTENDPFAGPSPDDVVIKAQTSKGSTRSGG